MTRDVTQLVRPFELNVWHGRAVPVSVGLKGGLAPPISSCLTQTSSVVYRGRIGGVQPIDDSRSGVPVSVHSHSSL